MKRLIIGLAVSFLCIGCSGNKPYSLNLMSSPDVYDEEAVNPFTDNELIELDEGYGLLYATDREPAEDKAEFPFYQNARGHVLRLGSAHVSLGDGEVTWEEARKISLLKNRTAKYPLRVSEVEEYGVLPASQGLISEGQVLTETDEQSRFFGQLNTALERRSVKDVFIYVHGYKVVFDNPVLVASELWHYLGYEGVFIAYAWPSTPSTWAYASDLETATYSSRNLRFLIEAIARDSQVERIHIIGYSAGTRVVTNALWQLALIHGSDQAVQSKLKLYDVILLGSDLDADLAMGFASDGMLDVVRKMTVYQSSKDKALGLSSWLFGRGRVGQVEAEDVPMLPSVTRLIEQGKLELIDVSHAADATRSKGHDYFRRSPWVSSDVLMQLRYDLSPAERGLEPGVERMVWRFPEDYIKRLRVALFKANPDFEKRARALEEQGLE